MDCTIDPEPEGRGWLMSKELEGYIMHTNYRLKAN